MGPSLWPSLRFRLAVESFVSSQASRRAVRSPFHHYGSLSRELWSMGTQCFRVRSLRPLREGTNRTLPAITRREPLANRGSDAAAGAGRRCHAEIRCRSSRYSMGPGPTAGPDPGPPTPRGSNVEGPEGISIGPSLHKPSWLSCQVASGRNEAA